MAATDLNPEMLKALISAIVEHGGDDIYSAVETRRAKAEQERAMKQQEEWRLSETKKRDGWMQEHIKQLVDAAAQDPEYDKLIGDLRLSREDLDSLVEGTLHLKDKAPVVFKHMLKNPDALKDFLGAQDSRDAGYALSNAFFQALTPQAVQPQNNEAQEKPKKIPSPKLVPDVEEAATETKSDPFAFL